MKRNLLDFVKQTSKYWWTSLLVGIFAIILGFWCISTPGTTLVALTYVFIVIFFISGIFDITNAIANRQIYDGWGWTLTGGIIDILFGFILLTLPLAIITTVLVYFVGFWIMFRSIWTIGVSVELQRYTNATWLLVLAILGLIFSFFYLISPVFNGVFVVILVSIAFITYGVFRIYYGFRLKAINDEIKQIGSDKD